MCCCATFPCLQAGICNFRNWSGQPDHRQPVLIDTNRDGIDIDCCKNVRVSNCSVNSPWDDAICPKSSFALGYARTTENVTITDCYVTGAYQLGTMLDGTWKRWPTEKSEQVKAKPYFPREFNGSIKLGTESNGGFKNITISNCVFDGSKGFAVESSDGACDRSDHILRHHDAGLHEHAFISASGRTHARASRRSGGQVRGVKLLMSSATIPILALRRRRHHQRHSRTCNRRHQDSRCVFGKHRWRQERDGGAPTARIDKVTIRGPTRICLATFLQAGFFCATSKTLSSRMLKLHSNGPIRGRSSGWIM